MLEITKYNEAERQLKEFQIDVSDALLYTESLEIKNRMQAQETLEYIARVRTIKKSVEEKKKTLTEKAKEYVSKISSFAKTFLEPLEEIEGRLGEKLHAWRELVRKEEEKERVLVEDLECLGISIIRINQDEGSIKSESASVYDRISHRIDVCDVNLIPREYLMPDMKKLALAVKNGVREISGITITEETKTVVRKK